MSERSTSELRPTLTTNTPLQNTQIQRTSMMIVLWWLCYDDCVMMNVLCLRLINFQAFSHGLYPLAAAANPVTTSFNYNIIINNALDMFLINNFLHTAMGRKSQRNSDKDKSRVQMHFRYETTSAVHSVISRMYTQWVPALIPFN